MNTSSSARVLHEIAIANLGPFLILVPTEKIYSPHSNSILGFPIPRRVYSESGWVFDPNTHKISGSLTSLQLTSPFPDDSPFTIDKRLAQGVPLSFELTNSGPFPKAIASLALFQYQFQDNLAFHHGVFRNLQPTFVRVYPFQSIKRFPKQAARCIHDELQVKLHQRVYLEFEDNP